MKKILLLLIPISLFMVKGAEARTSFLVCESIGHNYKRCYSNEPIRRAHVEQQLSSSDCHEGDSWGFDRDFIWVDDGCRARFRIDSQSEEVVTREMTCESWGNHSDNRCYVNGDISSIVLLDEYSHYACDFGHTWAWTQDYLRVTNGCSGLFRVRYRPYR